MSEIKAIRIHNEKFTATNLAEHLIEEVGPDKKVDAAFLVVRAEGKQFIMPMGNPIYQYDLLASGAIEKAIKVAMNYIGNELGRIFCEEIKSCRNGGGKVWQMKYLVSRYKIKGGDQGVKQGN